MTIQEITAKTTWEQFVLENSPQTFLHSWHWGEIQKESGESIKRLGFLKDDQLVAIVLLILVKAKRGRHYLVPHGPILKNQDQAEQVLASLASYTQAKSKQDKSVALKLAPLLLNTPKNQQLLQKLRFRAAPIHVHAELTWILEITPAEDQLLANMRKTTRHAIRKADKAGITTEITTNPDSLDRFWPLYTQTKTRHNFIPFPKDFLASQINHFSKDNQIFFAFARHHDQDVAGAILIHYGSTVYYYHGASKKLPSSLPAAQALQWSAIQEAKRRSAHFYNFWGIAPKNQPQHPFAGITVFKQGFGGRAIDYLPAHDLPLSIGYWPLFLVETYRKIRRGF